VQGLQEAGFAVDQTVDGAEGLQLALTTPYDVAVIDIMVPTLDGLSLIGELRQHKRLTPVIILSAKHSVDDDALSFEYQRFRVDVYPGRALRVVVHSTVRHDPVLFDEPLRGLALPNPPPSAPARASSSLPRQRTHQGRFRRYDLPSE
jgi:CheY-like chemotaxis protein